MKLLKEGTWALEPEYHDEAIQKIESLKDWLCHRFGDDELFDDLDSAIRRINYLTNNKE